MKSRLCPASPKIAALCASRTPVPSPAQAAIPTDKLAEAIMCLRHRRLQLWTWDTNEQPDPWNAMTDGAVIDQALSPKTGSDPCG